jgi:hypothetical protein
VSSATRGWLAWRTTFPVIFGVNACGRFCGHDHEWLAGKLGSMLEAFRERLQVGKNKRRAERHLARIPALVLSRVIPEGAPTR